MFPVQKNEPMVESISSSYLLFESNYFGIHVFIEYAGLISSSYSDSLSKKK